MLVRLQRLDGRHKLRVGDRKNKHDAVALEFSERQSCLGKS
jgi:hypothetical protein